MPRISRTADAAEDCIEIWSHIAEDNPSAADRLIKQIESRLELYAQFPGMGAARDELMDGLRSFPVGNYLVFYKVVPDGILVMRVLHGSRHLRRQFRSGR